MSRLISAALSVAFGVTAPAFANSAELSVVISGINSEEGALICRLFTVDSKFPREGELNSVTSEVSEGTSSCTFKNLSTGQYAIAVAHDANGNGILDQNFIGLPTEGFGFSGNARIRFGPPSFSKAAITVSDAKTVLKLRMQYR